jgi:hypothetical protein
MPLRTERVEGGSEGKLGSFWRLQIALRVELMECVCDFSDEERRKGVKVIAFFISHGGEETRTTTTMVVWSV